MLKLIVDHFNSSFDESDLEKILKVKYNSDKRIKRLLDTISILRFVFFPISLALYLTAFLIAVLVSLGITIGMVIETIFNYISDSLWLNTGWFGLSRKDIEDITLVSIKETLDKVDNEG